MRDTRAELLNEAEVLVRRRGYSGFSYGDLATAIGIRKASIHHHFPAKADLAVALLASFDARYDEAMAAVLAATPDAPGRLRAYAAFYRDGVEKGLGCLCAAFVAELDTLPTVLRADLSRFFAKHTAWVEAVLREGIADGTVRSGIDAAPMARLVVASLEGALMMERALDGTAGFATAFSALEAALKPGP